MTFSEARPSIRSHLHCAGRRARKGGGRTGDAAEDDLWSRDKVGYV
jgi:hypothetical protein